METKEDVGEMREDGSAMSPGFVEQLVFQGLTLPTAIRFARDGRVFVAEKGGVIKEFPGVDDTRMRIVADLAPSVHSFGDRGLMDIELDPRFPDEPYLYALYTLDGRVGDSVATGTLPRYNDSCPDARGAACLVGGRLVRLTVSADRSATEASETVMIENWPQQFLSHSVGALAFGPDGRLYVSGGDGASFNQVDFGAIDDNPLDEPPAVGRGSQKPPAAMGGALRAQVVEPPAGQGFVPSFSGKVVRVDPARPPGLDATWHAEPIASGLRNPFRMTFRPGTGELWIGDVGWNTWEEIDRVADVGKTGVSNFGWPCFEGSDPQPGYQSAGLSICSDLYGRAAAHAKPEFSYPRGRELLPEDGCGTGSSAVTGLAFYPGGSYPAEFEGSLFVADLARRCIWSLPVGADGRLVPARGRVLARQVESPVHLRIGPGNDLYVVSLAGSVRRFEYGAGNRPPRPSFTAEPRLGPLPLAVTFDGRSTVDHDAGERLTLSWDLDGDGVFDRTGPAVTHTYTTAGRVEVRLRVVDGRGAAAESTMTIWPGRAAPRAVIETSAASWQVGQEVAFSGYAVDGTGSRVPETALSWTILAHHCPGTCHEHVVEELTGRGSGHFIAQDHEYPTTLSLVLVARDQEGLEARTERRLEPRTTTLSLDSRPRGAVLAFNGTSAMTPFRRTVVVGSSSSVSAPSQVRDFRAFRFERWSDRGAQSHAVVAKPGGGRLVATFEAIPIAEIAAEATDILITGEDISQAPMPPWERLRDGVMPPPASAEQSDQVLIRPPSGSNEVALGYAFAGKRLFTRVRFQEGAVTQDGGYFEALRVEVRSEDRWVAVKDLRITPVYPGYNAHGWESFSLDFETMAGDAIRLAGVPGGEARSATVAELQVWAQVLAAAR